MYPGARCIPCNAEWRLDTRGRWCVRHRPGCPSFKRGAMLNWIAEVLMALDIDAKKLSEQDKVRLRGIAESFKRLDGLQTASQSDMDHAVKAQLWRDLDGIVERLKTPNAAPRGHRKGTDEGKALGIATALAYLSNLTVDEIREQAMRRYRLRKGSV